MHPGSIVTTFLPMVKLVKEFIHMANVLVICVTSSPIMNSVNILSANTELPEESTLPVRLQLHVTFPVQPANGVLPKYVTVLGITVVFNEQQPLNAFE